MADHLADCWVEKQAAQKAAATVGKMGHAMAVQMAGEMDVVTAGLKVVLSAASKAASSVDG